MQQNQGLDRQVMRSLQDMLMAHHQYVPIYRHAYQILQNYDTDNDVDVQLCLSPGLDHRRYNHLVQTQWSLEISFFDIVMDLCTTLVTSTQLMSLSNILYSSLMVRMAGIQR